MKKIILGLFVMLVVVVFGTKTISLKADATVTLKDGASIRLDDPAGLRFEATVSEAVEGAEYGIAFYRGETTKDNVVVGGNNVTEKAVDELNSNLSYSVSMVGFPEYAYSQKITARAYIKVGESYTYSDNVVTRSIVDVAVKAYENGTKSTLINTLYQYNLKKTNVYLNGASFTFDTTFTLTSHNTGADTGYYLTLTDAGKTTGYGKWFDRIAVKYIPTIGAYQVVKVFKSGTSTELDGVNYDFVVASHSKATDTEGRANLLTIVNSDDPTKYYLQFNAEAISGVNANCSIDVNVSTNYEIFMGNVLHLNSSDTLPTVTKGDVEFLGWFDNADFTGSAITTRGNATNIYARWADDTYEVNYELSDGSWSWTTGTVSDGSGIDSVSTLPEVFMADFYQYLSENNLLNSSKVNSSLRVSSWSDFSKLAGDPYAVYNKTSTGVASAADGYSELFFDSISGTEAVGGFLGTSPYKEKYFYVTNHIIQLTSYKYSVTNTASNYKACFGFVLDGYFYGTQGLLASSKTGYETFNYLRSVVPTPTTGYNGKTVLTRDYTVTTAVRGDKVTLVAPVKVGYAFIGWYTSSDFTGEPVTTVNKSSTVYAKWYDLNAPAPVHNITYVMNDVSDSPATHVSGYPTSFTQGNGVTLLKAKRSGYVFLGWSLDADGKNIVTSITKTTVTDVTLYANWIEIDENGWIIDYEYENATVVGHTPESYDEFTTYFWNEFYKWSGLADGVEEFKALVLSSWSSGAAGDYPLYNIDYDETAIDNNYFVHASSYHDVWFSWLKTFDNAVSMINNDQSVWISPYATYIRLNEFFTNADKTYWTDTIKETVWATFNIPGELTSVYYYGDEFDLPSLKSNSGKKFLGWYDEDGQLVTSITSTTMGNIVLTAMWSDTIEIDDFIDGSYVTESYVEPENTITIKANTIKDTSLKISWRSLNPTIATVDENGVVTGVKAGYAEIEAYVEGSNVNLTFGVTVIPLSESDFFKYIAAAHNEEVIVYNDLNVAYGAYYTDMIGSVSNYLFNTPYKVDKSYFYNPGRASFSSVEFITVHYNGMPQASVDGARCALSLYNGFKAGTAKAQWHYSTGNDGIFQCMPDTQRAAHAGDGSRTVSWTNSGVKATSNTKPTYGRSGGYLTINGTKSKIAFPSGYESTRLTWFGPAWKVYNGYYYIAALYYNSTYKYVCNGGGNANAIGIESACNKGSDLWYTYQITAQLVANLLKNNNLDTTRVYGHHAFSGKDCPQTLLQLNGDPWNKFMALVESEYAILMNMSNYSISMVSNNPDILNNKGRITSIPTQTTTVSYTVTVTNNSTGVSKTATFSSIVHGSYLD